MADEYLFDISNHNDPVIDWARVVEPDDVPGGWLKLTQATDFVDGLADDYVAQAKDDGVLLGGYHFGDHRYDAAAQAKFFFDRAAALGLLDAGDLAPMYDVENWQRASWPDRATIRRHVNIWLDEAVRRGCKRALVYGSLSWWLGKMLVPEDYQRDDIEVLNWVAVYNGRPGDLQGWAHPRDALHQYTSDGTFDGIDGRVDKNKTLNGRTSAGLTIGGDGVLSDEQKRSLDQTESYAREMWQVLVDGTYVPNPDEAKFNKDLAYVLDELPKRITMPVTMTEADRTAIAADVRAGLLEDLAPLLELAERLKD